MRFLIACAVTGALIGFSYMWWRMGPGTRSTLDKVLSVDVPLDNKALRAERARTIGYIRGTRLSGAVIIAACGAGVGLVLGAITLAISWFLG